MGVSASTKREAQQEIAELKGSIQRPVDENMKMVIKKIDNNPFYQPLHHNLEAKMKFVDCLSDPKRLQETYLNPNWTITMEMHDRITKLHKEQMEKKNKKENQQFLNAPEQPSAPVAKHPSHFGSAMQSSSNAEEQIQQEEEEEPVNMKDMIADPEAQLTNKLKIKLVISDMHADDKFKQSIRQIASPVLYTLGAVPKFGMFHTAVIVGPFKLEWNNSGLCVPRKVVANAALLCADIDELTTLKDFKTALDSVTNVIIHWNTKMHYIEKNGNRQEGGNCQDFVDDILAALGIDVKFNNSALGVFLESIRKNGKNDMVFPVSDDFRQKFNINEKSIKFETHRQLDEFVKKLGVGILKSDSWKSERILLKSFDRAFWMQHLKQGPAHLASKPLTTMSTNHALMDTDKNTPFVIEMPACPFEDPAVTHSLLIQK